jgi:hypothetical protein
MESCEFETVVSEHEGCWDFSGGGGAARKFSWVYKHLRILYGSRVVGLCIEIQTTKLLISL